MNFEISKDSLQKIATYLTARPWGEVNELIGLIANLKPTTESLANAATPAASTTPPVAE